MHDEEAMVSIVIPTFKRAERLENAISSCLNQSYKNLEIIVIDDNGLGSENQLKTKNNIDNIIERFNDQRIKYIPNARNMGGAIARNIGVDNSSGEYIAFLDDDDLLHPDSIKLRLEAIAGHDVDFCVSDMNIIDEHENYVECDSNSFRGYNLIDFILDGNFYTPMLLINKGVFLQVGGFTDSPRYQDYILMIKLLSRNFSLHHLNNRLFYHIRHADERISTTTSENVKRGRLRIIELQDRITSYNVCYTKLLRSCLKFSRRCYV